MVELSATSVGAVELRKHLDEALNRLRLTGERTVLFVDEVRRRTPVSVLHIAH